VREDFELLDAWRAGDVAAGGELFQRHFPAIRRFFRNKIAPEDAEDAIQRVFLACVESRDAFRGEASVRTYLFTIARNELYRRIRKNAHDRVRAEPDLSVASLAALGLSPASVIARDEEHAMVLAALRELPVEQQVMLELKYWERASSADLAAVMGIPEATVRTRLFRARRALREALERAAQGRSWEDLITSARP
jgi:RNA polymerase sigma-70 factor (ECF subfamily)